MGAWRTRDGNPPLGSRGEASVGCLEDEVSPEAGAYLSRDATQSAVMPQLVVRTSVTFCL